MDYLYRRDKIKYRGGHCGEVAARLIEEVFSSPLKRDENLRNRDNQA